MTHVSDKMYTPWAISFGYLYAVLVLSLYDITDEVEYRLKPELSFMKAFGYVLCLSLDSYAVCILCTSSNRKGKYLRSMQTALYFRSRAAQQHLFLDAGKKNDNEKPSERDTQTPKLPCPQSINTATHQHHIIECHETEAMEQQLSEKANHISSTQLEEDFRRALEQTRALMN
eukprot:1931577-Rhodomonas_salina.5